MARRRLRTAIVSVLILIAVDVIALLVLHMGIVPYRPPAAPTLLMKAAAADDPEGIRLALSSGDDVNAHQGRTFRLGICFIAACPDTSVPVGATPLMFAADAQALDAVRTLLDAGARIDAQNEVGEDAIDRAIQHLSTERGRAVFRVLMDRRGTPLRASAANAALFESSRYGLIDIAHEVLPGVLEDLPVELAMCEAATRGELDVLQLLQARLGTLPARLVNCVGAGQFATLVYVLDHGIDPNQRYEGGPTLLERLVSSVPATLYQTCDCRQLEPLYMIELLLQRGADPHSVAHPGAADAVQIARLNQRPAAAQLLQGGRVELHAPGGTPLVCANSTPPCSAELPSAK